MRRMTIFLPDDLHEQLRQDAFRAKVTMAELIRSKLRTPRNSRTSSQDPILKVAGICRGPVLSNDIDDSVYGK